MKINGVILFGDSVFFGYGASRKEFGCGRLLKKVLSEVPVIIKARNNDTTTDALKRIETEVIKKKEFSHVFVLFGNNDSRLIDYDTPKCSVKEYHYNLVKIISVIQNNDKMPILCNLQPVDNKMFSNTLPEMRQFLTCGLTPDEWHKQYSDEALRVAAKLKVESVNIESPLRDLGLRGMYVDGMHPNDLGHQKVSDLLRNTLIKLSVV